METLDQVALAVESIAVDNFRECLCNFRDRLHAAYFTMSLRSDPIDRQKAAFINSPISFFSNFAIVGIDGADVGLDRVKTVLGGYLEEIFPEGDLRDNFKTFWSENSRNLSLTSVIEVSVKFVPDLRDRLSSDFVNENVDFYSDSPMVFNEHRLFSLLGVSVRDLRDAASNESSGEFYDDPKSVKCSRVLKFLRAFGLGSLVGLDVEFDAVSMASFSKIGRFSDPLSLLQSLIVSALSYYPKTEKFFAGLDDTINRYFVESSPSGTEFRISDGSAAYSSSAELVFLSVMSDEALRPHIWDAVWYSFNTELGFGGRESDFCKDYKVGGFDRVLPMNYCWGKVLEKLDKDRDFVDVFSFFKTCASFCSLLKPDVDGLDETDPLFLGNLRRKPTESELAIRDDFYAFVGIEFCLAALNGVDRRGNPNYNVSDYSFSVLLDLLTGNKEDNGRVNFALNVFADSVKRKELNDLFSTIGVTLDSGFRVMGAQLDIEGYASYAFNKFKYACSVDKEDRNNLVLDKFVALGRLLSTSPCSTGFFDENSPFYVKKFAENVVLKSMFCAPLPVKFKGRVLSRISYETLKLMGLKVDASNAFDVSLGDVRLLDSHREAVRLYCSGLSVAKNSFYQVTRPLVMELSAFLLEGVKYKNIRESNLELYHFMKALPANGKSSGVIARPYGMISLLGTLVNFWSTDVLAWKSALSNVPNIFNDNPYIKSAFKEDSNLFNVLIDIVKACVIGNSSNAEDCNDFFNKLDELKYNYNNVYNSVFPKINTLQLKLADLNKAYESACSSVDGLDKDALSAKHASEVKSLENALIAPNKALADARNNYYGQFFQRVLEQERIAFDKVGQSLFGKIEDTVKEFLDVYGVKVTPEAPVFSYTSEDHKNLVDVLKYRGGIGFLGNRHVDDFTILSVAACRKLVENRNWQGVINSDSSDEFFARFKVCFESVFGSFESPNNGAYLRQVFSQFELFEKDWEFLKRKFVSLSDFFGGDNPDLSFWNSRIEGFKDRVTSGNVEVVVLNPGVYSWTSTLNRSVLEPYLATEDYGKIFSYVCTPLKNYDDDLALWDVVGGRFVSLLTTPEVLNYDSSMYSKMLLNTDSWEFSVRRLTDLTVSIQKCFGYSVTLDNLSKIFDLYGSLDVDPKSKASWSYFCKSSSDICSYMFAPMSGSLGSMQTINILNSLTNSLQSLGNVVKDLNSKDAFQVSV